MTIGIDVDDTITKTTETLNSIPGFTRELFDEILTRPDSVPDLDERLEEAFGNMEVFDNAIEVINDLKSKGNKIVIITARGGILDVLVPITKKFIKDKGIKIDDAIFYQERKGDACIKAGVDVFIDDNEIVLDEVKEKGIKTIRFSKNNVVSNHVVLHNWLEVKEYIARLGDNDGKNH
jgi:MoaA/NifB/PqqE/SkfB family radical SAM enzyme